MAPWAQNGRVIVTVARLYSSLWWVMLGACSVAEPTVRSSAAGQVAAPIVREGSRRVVEDRGGSGARGEVGAKSGPGDDGARRDEAPDVRTACSAWSLEQSGPADARDSADLESCRFAPTGEERQ